MPSMLPLSQGGRLTPFFRSRCHPGLLLAISLSQSLGVAALGLWLAGGWEGNDPASLDRSFLVPPSLSCKRPALVVTEACSIKHLSQGLLSGL